MYDVIVIGGGPGGLNAHLFATRAKLKSLLITGYNPGGQVKDTAFVENYIGLGKSSGGMLADRMIDHSKDFNGKQKMSMVTGIEDKADKKEVTLDSGEKLETKTIILSTGSTPNKLGIPGEEEFANRGVSYCSVCDGPFHDGDDIIVVGGGDSAVEEADYLSLFGDSVTVIHRRDTLRAVPYLQERAINNDKIKFIWNTEVKEIEGDQGVTNVKLVNNVTGEESDLNAQGVFVYIGHNPQTNLVEQIEGVETNKDGYIITDENMMTGAEGIYAVGDVRVTPLRQIITAASDGAIAGNHVYKYLQEN